MSLQIGLVFENPPSAIKKRVSESLRVGLQATVEDWHDTILAGHFEETAAARYGFEQRSRAYTRRKKRSRHHNRPMVWSGVLRKTVLSNAIIKSSTKQGRVTMRTPRALNFSSRIGYPDLKAELTAIDGKDVQRMETTLEKHMMQHLGELNVKRRRRRKK